MKYYEKEYVIYSGKCKKDMNFIHISDLHECMEIKEDFLYDLLRKIASYGPNFICFTGDLFNDARYTTEKAISSRITLWLEGLGKIAPVIMIRGNHDGLSFENSSVIEYDSLPFFESLNNIPRIHFLKNHTVVNNVLGVSISGVDLLHNNLDYYEKGKESECAYNSFVIPLLEDIESQTDEKNFNILLTHFPVRPQNIEKSKYRLALSGHMHDGAVPNFVDKGLPTNRGILAPIGGIFPRLARGSYQVSNDTKGIIASPLTVSAKHNDNPLVRTLYKPGISSITIKKI